MKKMSNYARDRMQYKNKPRKVLSLEERVQALRMFDQTPVYQRVATVFGCSWEQIKNVVLSREEILTYYARCQTIMPNEHRSQIRKKKIIFLGNVVFEYIKRAFYHKSAQLNEETIRCRALEFRDSIKIEQFYPNSAWLNDFKRVFNIKLPNPDNIFVAQTPPESLDCDDIIAYCRTEIDGLLGLAKEQIKKNISKNRNENDVSSTSIRTEATQSNEKSFNDEKNDNINGNDDDDDDDDVDDDDTAAEDEEGLTIDFSHYEYNDTTTRTTTTLQNNEAKEKRSAPEGVDSSPICPKRIKQERPSKSPLLVRRISTPHNAGDTKSSSPSPTPTARLIEPSSTTPNLVNFQLSQDISMPPPIILSSKSALTYLLPLQDYALGEEDFIAINLLANLAEHYRQDMK